MGLAVTGSLVLGACEGSGDAATDGAEGASAAPASAVSTVTASSTALGPAPLPVYSVGDTYVFDSPRETWTITQVTEEKVAWESDLGGTRQTTVDPLLPSLRSAAPEIGAVTRIITEKQGDLWPLVVGNETTFVVAAGMDQPPYSQSLRWSCRVVGTNLVTVPAGSFNAYKVACARSDGLRLNTYHAPAVGYFVRREVSTAENQGQARSLVAYKNGTGDRLIAARPPGPADMNPLNTAPRTAAEVRPLEPIGGGTGAGAASASSPGSAPSPAPSPALAPSSSPASADGGPRPLVPPHETPPQGTPPQGTQPAGEATAWPVQRTPRPAADAAAPASTPGAAMAPAPSSRVASAPVPAAAGAGAWSGAGVRLASFGSAAAADSGWATFRAAYPGLLGALSPRIEHVQIEGRGTFHRLYAGPFATKTEARALCGKISEMGQTCDVRTFN